MKGLNEYMLEKLIINKDVTSKDYKYFPKTKKELKEIIIEKMNEWENWEGEGEKPDELDLNDINVSLITDMSELLDSYSSKIPYKLYKINCSDWDCSEVTDFSYMFKGTNFTHINVSNWRTYKARKFDGMFSRCDNLQELNLSNWIVSSAQSMKFMFYGCESLKTIGDISKWNIKQVMQMRRMFANCKSLQLDMTKLKFNKKANIDDINLSASNVKIPE